MKVYISGPMTGLPDCNYPAFDAAEALLSKDPELQVVNPANAFGRDQGRPREDYLRVDARTVAECDAIHMLPGWQNSSGARMEYMIAKECGLTILDYPTCGGLPPEPVEYEASRIVRNGERQAAYGHPNQDFERTALMWTGVLGHEVTMQDVALMMACLKISRLRSSPGHHDSVVDLIGYAICYSRLDEGAT